MARRTVVSSAATAARRRLADALGRVTLLGVTTNQSFLVQLVESELFERAETFTTSVEAQVWQAPAIPEYAHVAAESALAKHAQRAAASGDGHGDLYSPWQSLGAFRMGT